MKQKPQSTTVRILLPTKLRLQQIQIDLAKERGKIQSVDDTIDALIAAWYMLEKMTRGKDDR